MHRISICGPLEMDAYGEGNEWIEVNDMMYIVISAGPRCFIDEDSAGR